MNKVKIKRIEKVIKIMEELANDFKNTPFNERCQLREGISALKYILEKVKIKKGG